MACVPIGYQTCAGLLDHFTDWFYDGSTGRLYFYGPAPRRTGIYGFHVPPLHTRHVKAYSFLGAGSIIHAVHSNEMSAMGGLRKYMPITHWTFLIACLAIAGIPPFSGFFSKDEILAACFQYSPAMGWVMTVIAAMTAFYMFRLYYGIFWGAEPPRASSNSDHSTPHGNLEAAPCRPHESPLAMTFPLIFLAVVTCLAGFIPFGHFISSNGESYSIHLDLSVAVTSVVIAIISIGIATWMYKSQTACCQCTCQTVQWIVDSCLSSFLY